MRTIRDWIDEAKEVTGSDYATAKRLGTSRQNLSHYRKGRQLPSNKICERLAEVLDVNPLEIIASCEVEKDPEEAGRWQKWLGAAAILSCVVFADSLLDSKAYANVLMETPYTLCEVSEARDGHPGASGWTSNHQSLQNNKLKIARPINLFAGVSHRALLQARCHRPEKGGRGSGPEP